MRTAGGADGPGERVQRLWATELLLDDWWLGLELVTMGTRCVLCVTLSCLVVGHGGRPDDDFCLCFASRAEL